METPSFKEIFTSLESCLPARRDKLPLHEPLFDGNEWTYLKACVDEGWVSSVGRFVDQFEQQLADFTQIPHAIATVNGTAALHMCLLLAGVQPEDEVLTPALTFIATTNAIHYCQAIPHFVESNAQDLGVDASALTDYLQDIAAVRAGVCYNRYTQRPIRALVVMHTFGHPVALHSLLALCERYHLVLIEDAAEALGSYSHNQHVGGVGRLAALSFNGNKIITTGGGGAILTRDTTLAKQAKHLTTTAKVPHRWAFEHDAVGYNYRLPNLNAALGCAQLEQLPQFLTAKRALAQRYQQALQTVTNAAFISEPAHCHSNYWLNAIRLQGEWAPHRDAFLQASHARGLLCRPVWALQHRLPMYQACPHMPMPVAEQLAATLVNLPSSANLSS